MVHIRPSLTRLPSYVAGGKLPGGAALASNESPYGPLPGITARLAELVEGVSRYPDASATGLRQSIAARLGLTADRVAVGAGSSEVCGQLLHTVVGAGDEVIFGWRSFEAYPILTGVAGGTAVRIALREHVLDLNAMAEAVTARTRLVLVCNPNNPTSTAVGEAELRAFVDRVPEDVLIVVDEAYREYTDPVAVPNPLALFADRPNVVVLRTFSKAFSLAGLRVGYCVGAPEIIAQVRKTQVPFSVSALAQEAAIAALAQGDEVARRARLTVGERERVAARLRSVGYEVPLSQANFLWLPFGQRSADFAEHCLKWGVMLRAFAGEGVRVTIGLPEENDVFLASAETWAGGNGF